MVKSDYAHGLSQGEFCQYSPEDPILNASDGVECQNIEVGKL
jgi:hypothetical protein